MSRIYEALQKAESEKQVERDAPLREQPVVPDSTFRDDAVEATPVWPNEALAQPQPLPDYSPVRNGSNVSFDPTRVARYPWHPLPQRLPALMERGLAVEQFRSLRSRLFELRDIKPLKSVLVTSGISQEGKSFVAANLAFSLARHKASKVLLIDGDMRRYTLHEVLGTVSSPGLADYLAGRAEMTEVMQRAEIEDQEAEPSVGLPNLTFIPGGNGGDKAADLSGNPRFGELIKAASRYFDWIIIDSSPVLPVSDAVNLARACDGVLLVARNGVTKFSTAQRAQSEMKASNVLGFVLNAADNSPSINSYYGYDAKYS
jgi:capsular exopolysaccharide synthesis family protein